MKNNKIILLIIIVIVIICGIAGYIYFNKKTNNSNTNNKKNTPVEKKCTPFTGGAFNLVFNTNGGEEIASMHVCIACSPDSYEDLPTPVREGYNFEGWYYDEELTNKIEFTNSKDFTQVPEYDKDNCMIGYKDIGIYAMWSEVQKKEEVVQQPVVNEYVPSEPAPVEQNNEVVPAEPTKEVYMPSVSGTVVKEYGYMNQKYIKIRVNDPYILYPINDGPT